MIQIASEPFSSSHRCQLAAGSPRPWSKTISVVAAFGTRFELVPENARFASAVVGRPCLFVGIAR